MIHVFHHNDQDGLGSAALVRRAFPKQAMRFICCCYDVPLDRHLDSIDSNDQVYIVDYSFKESTVKELLGIIEKVGVDHVVWLDQHNSSAELLKPHPDLLKLGGTVDLRFSGMALTWMFLQGLPYSEESFQKCPFCVRLVSDYDIWTKVYPECDPFKMGMDTHDLSVESEIWDKVLSDKSCLLEVVNQGRTVKNFLKHYYAHKMQRYGFVTRFAGYDCLAINIKDDSTVFGDSYTKYPLCVIFQTNGKGWFYTVYSSHSDIDCTAIAAQYGGGGHKYAAGFRTDELLDAFKCT